MGGQATRSKNYYNKNDLGGIWADTPSASPSTTNILLRPLASAHRSPITTGFARSLQKNACHRASHRASDRPRLRAASEMLALTFTNKAAEEMRERVEKLLGEDWFQRHTVVNFLTN